MSHDLDRLLRGVRMRLPGALDDAIKHELFEALDEFLQGSSIWREDIPITTVAGRVEYEIEPDEHSSIIRLMGVSYTDNRRVPVPASLKPEPTMLTLHREMNAGESLLATVAMTVVDPVDTDKLPVVPEWIIIKYRRGITDGVLHRMMAQPAKPYTSAVLAEFHGRRFRSAISAARVDADHEQLHGGQRWAFPQGFATGRN